MLLREVFSCGRLLIGVRYKLDFATAQKVRCSLILLKAENSLFMKFTSFTLLEVVDKCLVFIYLMYANRFHNVGSQLKKERIVQHEL